MAIVFESYTTDTDANASSVAPVKPTGLAEGDLMVAQFTSVAWDASITLPSGFTQINIQRNNPDGFSQISYKIATSGDVAASNFTFSHDGGTGDIAAQVCRITGHDESSPIADSSSAVDATADTTASTTSISSPRVGNLLMFFVTPVGSDITVSSYAIATDNPTWTERYDFQQGGIGSALATAIRTQTTNTGAATATMSTSSKDISHLISVNSEPIDVTVNTTPLVASGTLPTVSITGDANVSANPLTMTVMTGEETVTTQENAVWTNEDGPPDTDWTFENI